MVKVQTKILEHRSHSSLQDALNEFLNIIEDSQLSDIKFQVTVYWRNNVDESLTAIVIYTPKSDTDHETHSA